MNGILLASIVENITTRKDGTLKITLGTNEVSQSVAGELFGLRNKLAATYLSPKETIPQRDLDQIDSIDIDLPGKSKSQRQRAVLFLIWQQRNESYKDFAEYYSYRMEQNIDKLKKELDSIT